MVLSSLGPMFSEPDSLKYKKKVVTYFFFIFNSKLPSLNQIKTRMIFSDFFFIFNSKLPSLNQIKTRMIFSDSTFPIVKKTLSLGKIL